MDNYSFKNDLIKSLEIAVENNVKYTYIFNPLIKNKNKL